MPLESGTYVNDLDIANPPSSDQRAQGDDHLRLIKKVLKNTFPGILRPVKFPRLITKVANYAVLASDDQALISVDASAGPVAITLPTVANGSPPYPMFIQVVKSDNSANAVTVTRAGADTINGGTSVTLTAQSQLFAVESDCVSNWTGVLADLMPAHTFKGNNTAGILAPKNLTQDELVTELLATKAEAEAGTSITRLSSPQRVAEQIAVTTTSLKITIFNTPGTANFIKDPRTKLLHVRASGAGGGGGGTVRSSGGPWYGGAGCCGTGAGGWLLASSVASPTVITIGTKGNGGAAGNNNGTAGTASSFGTHISCPGGFGGSGSSNAMGNSTLPDGPTFSASVFNTEVGTMINQSAILQAVGFPSIFGEGPLQPLSEGPGNNAVTKGSGGAGGRRDTNGSSAGGNGADGQIVVEEYF